MENVDAIQYLVKVITDLFLHKNEILHRVDGGNETPIKRVLKCLNRRLQVKTLRLNDLLPKYSQTVYDMIEYCRYCLSDL